MSDASERINQIKLPAGRGAYAVRRVKEAASNHNLPDVVARCELTEAAYVAQDRAEVAWGVVQRQGTAREEASALDRQIDSVIQSTYDTCQAQRKLAVAGITSPHAEAADLIIRRCFPLGTRPITYSPYEVEALKLREIAEAFADPKVAAAAQLLGVSAHLQFIADNAAAYEAFSKRVSAQMTSRQLAILRDHAHDELCELIALILAQTPGDALAPVRAALLSPIDQQSSILRAQRKARRLTTDIDPATGDERPLSPLAEDPNA
jgi:hypothetical protein